MKNYKLFLFISLAALTFAMSANAQKEIPDSTEVLFDANGSFTRVVATPEEVKSKMITVNPLIDDVIWRKVVLRVIDLREQQNRPLYYPHEDLEPESQKNLFSIIFSNFLEGRLTGYLSESNPDQMYIPRFAEEYVVNPDSFKIRNGLNEYGMGDPTTFDLVNAITKGITKYYIQEIWYFNKTASTFENKIIAIAPIFDEKYVTEDVSIKSGVWFWFPYEKLRPLLQEEFVRTSGRNVAPLTNFDDFFISRQFYSYIIKNYDHVNRPIDYNIEDNPDEIRKEQQKVEDEILNFEQDLWSY